jgi:NADH-quinone oxidoreductase subunit E
MLSETEIAEINTEIAASFDKRSACVEAMKIVQAHRGWVSDEALEDIAQILDMSPSELDGVATFYSLIFRQPVGRHVIKICDSVTCWVFGSESLIGYIGEKLGIQPGQTTKDNRFTLLPISCLGHCDHAPAMMIDNEIIGDLTKEMIDTLLAPGSRFE